MVVGKNRRYKDGSTNRQAAKIAYRLPLHTLKEEYTGYHQLQREGESLFSAFGTILNKLASSIDAQTSATRLAMENGEDAKEVALPQSQKGLRGRGISQLDGVMGQRCCESQTWLPR